MSFGALTSVSENGLKSFGFVVVTSKLHQEICEQAVSIQKGVGKMSTSYPFVVDLWMSNLDPTRPHNLSLENQKLEGSRVSAKDLRDVLTTSGHRDNGLYKRH